MGSSLSERVQAAMDYADLTPASLARITGVSTSAVLQILNGSTKSLKDTTVFRLAKACRVNAEWLVMGTGDMKIGAREPSAPYESLSERQRTVLQLFDGLTESQQNHVLEEINEKKRLNDKILEELLEKRGISNR